MSEIPEGYVLIPGRGRENAIAAIEATIAAGLDGNDVRTTADGYLIPKKAEAKYAAANKNSEPEAEPEPKKPAPRKPAAKKKS